MKAAVEIVAMAADAGLIPADKEVLSIAGTGKGADTAIIVQPANSTRIFDMTVKEIIAKPRTRYLSACTGSPKKNLCAKLFV